MCAHTHTHTHTQNSLVYGTGLFELSKTASMAPGHRGCVLDAMAQQKYHVWRTIKRHMGSAGGNIYGAA